MVRPVARRFQQAPGQLARRFRPTNVFSRRMLEVAPSPGRLSTAAVPPWVTDRVLHNREAEVAADAGAGARSFALVEALEHAGEILEDDAPALVAH